MRGVCTGLAELESVQLENGRYLNDGSCRRLEQAYYLYRACYDRLASRSQYLGRARWKVRPKQHQLEHAIYDFACANHTNPRYDANYMGEDAVRRSKLMAVASHPQYVSRHVLLKYALQVSLKYRTGSAQ